MKLGTTSHLISAYSALFTIASGVILWDFVRRADSTRTPAEINNSKAGPVASTQATKALRG